MKNLPVWLLRLQSLVDKFTLGHWSKTNREGSLEFDIMNKHTSLDPDMVGILEDVVELGISPEAQE